MNSPKAEERAPLESIAGVPTAANSQHAATNDFAQTQSYIDESFLLDYDDTLLWNTDQTANRVHLYEGPTGFPGLIDYDGLAPSSVSPAQLGSGFTADGLSASEPGHHTSSAQPGHSPGSSSDAPVNLGSLDFGPYPWVLGINDSPTAIAHPNLAMPNELGALDPLMMGNLGNILGQADSPFPGHGFLGPPLALEADQWPLVSVQPVLQPFNAVPAEGTREEIHQRVLCSFPGCRETFGRKSEMNRHAKKHIPPQLSCNVPGCDKRFYRNDKLRKHMKTCRRRVEAADDEML